MTDVLKKIRARANEPGTERQHGGQYVNGMLCAANMLEKAFTGLVDAATVREYVEARDAYEAATKPLSGFGHRRALMHGDPILLRHRTARAALTAAITPEIPCTCGSRTFVDGKCSNCGALISKISTCPDCSSPIPGQHYEESCEYEHWIDGPPVKRNKPNSTGEQE